MKKLIQAITALLAAVGLALVMVAPAGAASEGDTALHINSPGAYCGYAYAYVNASQPAPGNAFWFAEGVAEIKANNPCAWAYGSAQSYPAGYLKVQTALHCRWGGTGDTTIWTSPIASNTAGTGFVHTFTGGTTNPCQDPDHLGLQERVTVHTWFYLQLFGYVDYTDTTGWVNP